MDGAAERADVVVVAVIGSSVEMSIRARVMPPGEMASVNQLTGGPIANVRDCRFVVERQERRDHEAYGHGRRHRATSHGAPQSSQRPRNNTWTS